jgi:fructan beta-fructosidase
VRPRHRALVLAAVAALVAVGVVLWAGTGGENGGESGETDSTVDGSMTDPDDPFRPVVHFTTDRNWLNDPNGPVYLDGQYHLFYQYNPDGTVWGNIGWGHAVSSDLITWEERPMALRATETSMVFSGSAVHDATNTSGLCATADCLVAIYTGHRVDPASELTRQDQNIAVSSDGGGTWLPYEGNPVIDIEQEDFRDPYVIRHEPSDSWIMSVALPLERTVQFFRSVDLRSWEFVSEFGPAGATEGIWECPVLLELPVDGDPTDTRWVLKVDHNPGHVTGGSGAQYFVGHFDGTTFTTADGEPPRWVDHGPDFYCAMHWSAEPDITPGRTWIGWMSNWDYAASTPTETWRGAMTIPRVVSLATFPDGVALTQRPVAGLDAYRAESRTFAADDFDELAAQIDAAGVEGDALDITVRFEPGDAEEIAVRLRADDDGRLTTVGYSVADGQLFVDRTASGEREVHPSFPGRYGAPLPNTGEPIEFRIVLDRSSVEVFGPAGRPVVTALVFPGVDARGFGVAASGGTSGPVSLEVSVLSAERAQ